MFIINFYPSQGAKKWDFRLKMDLILPGIAVGAVPCDYIFTGEGVRYLFVNLTTNFEYQLPKYACKAYIFFHGTREDFIRTEQLVLDIESKAKLYGFPVTWGSI